MKMILHWLEKNSVMLINSGAVFGSTIVTSVFGFMYWWFAAHCFAPEVVGVGSAAISSMTMLGLFCMLGLGTALVTEIPRQPKQAFFLTSTSLMAVFIAGGLAGLLFAMIAPLFSHELSSLNADVFGVLLFALGVGLTSVSLVLDLALIAFLRGKKQFQRNALFAGSKLVFLTLISFLFSNLTGMSIYATWTLGNLLSIMFVLLPIVLRSKRPLRDYLPAWKLLRQVGGVALQHHLLNILLQFTPYVLPLIVTILLSAKMNALFYVSWMILNFVIYISFALTVVMRAMSSANRSSLARNVRSSIGLAFILVGLVVIVLQCMCQQILGAFGTAYLDGVWTLRILLLAAFPIIIKDHYTSICRIQDRLKQAMWVIAPCCLLELILTVLGTRLGGLLGLSLSWVLVNCVEAIWMGPKVYKAVFPGKSLAVPLEKRSKETTDEGMWLLDPIRWSHINTSPLPVVRFPYGEGIDPSKQPERMYHKQSSIERLAPRSQSLGDLFMAMNGINGKKRYQFKSLYFRPFSSSFSPAHRNLFMAGEREVGSYPCSNIS